MNRTLVALGVALSSLVLAAGCGAPTTTSAGSGIVLSGSEFASSAPRIARGPLAGADVRPHCRHSPRPTVAASGKHRGLPLCLRRSGDAGHDQPHR